MDFLLDGKFFKCIMCMKIANVSLVEVYNPQTDNRNPFLNNSQNISNKDVINIIRPGSPTRNPFSNKEAIPIMHPAIIKQNVEREKILVNQNLMPNFNSAYFNNYETPKPHSKFSNTLLFSPEDKFHTPRSDSILLNNNLTFSTSKPIIK
jgi:hypothetical protein